MLQQSSDTPVGAGAGVDASTFGGAGADLPFSGTPERYLRISIVLSVAIHAWLYGGFSAIKYFVHGETWMFGWKPVLIALASMVLFARFAYRWIMRLDAQYGSGSGWRLVRCTVKLPEAVHRPKR
jgi:hypothetical protein